MSRSFFDIEHRMRLHYDAFIHQSWLELRVEPRSSHGQTVHSFGLAVGPPTSVARYVDWLGNVVHHFSIQDYHDRIEVTAHSLVEIHPPEVDLSNLTEPPARDLGPLLDFTRLGGPVRPSDPLTALGREVALPATAPLGEQLQALGSLISQRFRYESGVTDYHSTTDHILESGSGVCQDFAHLLLGLLRLRGVACRYVSGYLHVTPRDADPSESHAWVEVFAGEQGWIAFDPTHDRVPNEHYVSVARGRHYDDVPPNRGIYRGTATESLEAEVTTTPSARRDVAELHEVIGAIEVPVYREPPASETAPEQRASDEAGPRQQQQQQ